MSLIVNSDQQLLYSLCAKEVHCLIQASLTQRYVGQEYQFLIATGLKDSKPIGLSTH